MSPEARWNIPRRIMDLFSALSGNPDAAWKDLEIERLKRSVLRLRIKGAKHAFIVKRFRLARGYLEQLVLRRWLPAGKLAHKAAELLAVAGDDEGQYVWHIYEDLGNWSFKKVRYSAKDVKAAVETFALMHDRFVDKPVLAECRLFGRDLGSHFFTSSVRDARRTLEAVSEPPDGPLAALRERLLRRLDKLWEMESERIGVLTEHGGPETFLHGDPTIENTFLCPAANGSTVRLIDWDRAGVGPGIFDVWTFAAQFPVDVRLQICSFYFDAVCRMGWRPPPRSELRFLLETIESARLANNIVWAALGAAEGHMDFGYEEMADVDNWFETLEPLPELKAAV